LFSVGRSTGIKNKVAKSSGYLQLILAIFGFIEVLRRFIEPGDNPNFTAMVSISLFALIGNATCLYLLQKSKSKEVHMQASMIFTSNDVIVNLGVIVAGILVFLSHSNYPDLFIGAIVFLLVGRGAFKILRLSKW
jgi:Co/Zn/Cd efflux system component